MTIDLSASTTSHGDALANFEDVLGTFFDDVIIGTSGPNNIEGAEGADEISGLAGDDVIFGGFDGFDDGSSRLGRRRRRGGRMRVRERGQL